MIDGRPWNETWGNYIRINIKPRSSEQGAWSPQTWRRTTNHWQLLSSCYINSLRQPYRPALTHYHPLSHQRVSFVLRLRQSFPEDCVRLKLSSTRASQAGLKEMMTRRRVRAVVTSNPGKRRPPVLLVQREAIRRGEITNFAPAERH